MFFTNLKFNSAVDLPLRLLKDSGPSAISIELTSLAPEGGGSNSLLLAFIQMIDSMLASGRDFDLAHGYLALFLKVSEHITPVTLIIFRINIYSFSCFISASPLGVVTGPRCHGSLASPLAPFGRRVGGATGIV